MPSSAVDHCDTWPLCPSCPRNHCPNIWFGNPQNCAQSPQIKYLNWVLLQISKLPQPLICIHLGNSHSHSQVLSLFLSPPNMECVPTDQKQTGGWEVGLEWMKRSLWYYTNPNPCAYLLTQVMLRDLLALVISHHDIPVFGKDSSTTWSKAHETRRPQLQEKLNCIRAMIQWVQEQLSLQEAQIWSLPLHYPQFWPGAIYKTELRVAPEINPRALESVIYISPPKRKPFQSKKTCACGEQTPASSVNTWTEE